MSHSDHTGSRRVPTPSQHELAAADEARARHKYGILVEMGARPKRPIQPQPTRTAFYENGNFYLFDDEGKRECQIPRGMDPMSHHWRQENVHFSEELGNWRDFRKYQQDIRRFGYLETALQLNNTDTALIYALAKLSDWQDFEGFQYHIFVKALTEEHKYRQEFVYFMECEGTTEQSAPSSLVHDVIHHWLSPFKRNQEDIEAAKQQLKWIKDQWPKVVAEALASISMAPECQSSLEMKFIRQTFAAFSVIQKLGGRPSHAVVFPDDSMDIFNRILHWSSETSKYKEELLQWKHFLKWQRGGPGEKPKLQWGDYQCPQLKSDLEFSADFEKFRRLEHESALTWLKCWQRIVRWHEEEIKTPQCYAMDASLLPAYRHSTPKFLYRDAEAARSHVRDSEQKVVDAAARLDTARQEHAWSTVGETGMECVKRPFLPAPSLSNLSSAQSSQLSTPFPSPPSSHSSQPSVSPQLPQTSQSTPSPQSSVRTRQARGLSDKGSSIDRQHQRLNKKNARKEEAKVKNIDTVQQALPTFLSDSHIVKDDDHVQIEKALEDPSPFETREQSASMESEDTVMTVFEDHSAPILSQPSQPSSPIPITNFKKSPVPAQGLTLRKTRSATKLTQATNSKVLKNTNEKSAKKAKALTKQQAMTLLDAASNKHSTVIGCPPRRSDPVKEKAALSATTAVPQLDTGQPAQPSQQRQPQETPNLFKIPESSTQRKRKREPHELEPLPESAQQKQKKRRTL